MLVVNQPPGQLDNGVGSGEVGWARAYRALRAEIMSGQVLPGMKLVERTISERLGMSRSSIRIALHILAAEGLVDLEPRIGARVAVIGYDEALAITAVREVLEGLAARLAAEHATPKVRARLAELVAAMKEAIQREDFMGYSQINSKLHGLIIASCKNRKLQRALDSILAQLLQHRTRGLLMPGRATASVREHERIATAIIERNPEAAESAMREHFRNVYLALDSQARPRKGF